MFDDKVIFLYCSLVTDAQVCIGVQFSYLLLCNERENYLQLWNAKKKALCLNEFLYNWMILILLRPFYVIYFKKGFIEGL